MSRPAPTPSRWPYLLALPLVVALGAWSAVWGWSEVLAYSPRQQMDRWEKQRGMPEAETGDAAERLLQSAVALNPGSAQMYFDLARLAEWRALGKKPWTRAARDDRKQAIGYAEQALARRSSWGLAWILLTQSRAFNGQFDPEGRLALERAMLLAPLEGPSQKQILRFGTAYWSYLEDDHREQLERIMRHGLQFQERATLKTLVNARLEAVIEPMLTSERQHNTLDHLIKRRDNSG